MKRALKFALLAGAGFVFTVSSSVFAASTPYLEPGSNEVYESYDAYLAHEEREVMAVPASVLAPAPTPMALAVSDVNAINNMQLLGSFTGGSIFNQLLSPAGAGPATNLANVSGTVGTVKAAMNLTNVVGTVVTAIMPVTVAKAGNAKAATTTVATNNAVSGAKAATATVTANNVVSGAKAAITTVTANNAVSGAKAATTTVTANNAVSGAKAATNTVIASNAVSGANAVSGQSANGAVVTNNAPATNEVATVNNAEIVSGAVVREESSKPQQELNAKGDAVAGEGSSDSATNALNVINEPEGIFGYSYADMIVKGIQGSDAARSIVPSNG